MPKPIDTCDDCTFCVDKADGWGRCHGEPPEPLGQFNEKNGKDLRKNITNGHKEADRGIRRKVKLTDRSCVHFSKN